MKNVSVTGMLILLLFVSVARAQPAGHTADQDVSLSWIQFRVIEVAMAVAKIRQLRLPDYRIFVTRSPWGDRPYVVFFADPYRPKDIRGSSPNMPEFEVRVAPDLRVIGFNFIR